MTQNHLSLFQLNQKVKEVLQNNFNLPVWIVAEISELRVNSSGHCYIELIEKDEDTDKVVARARAMIWSFTYRILQPYFKTATGAELTEGMKVLVNVIVEYHEIYGLSLNIRDIDPAYTIGDIAKRRQEVLNQLETEGVLTMNKELEFPIVIKNIAVISSKTAAGFGDFIDQLTGNEFGYQFNFSFFEAVMQGDNAPESIVNALDKIFENENKVDVVVIIRGGGAKADLFCFDDYWLAYHITQFPIPVLSGIGHERDDTITDLVAYKNLKTPTAVAEYIIENNYLFEQKLTEFEEELTSYTQEILSEQQSLLEKFENEIPFLSKNIVNLHNTKIVRLGIDLNKNVTRLFRTHNEKLDLLKYELKGRAKAKITNNEVLLNVNLESLSNYSRSFVRYQNAQLDSFKRIINGLSPQKVLKRGYTLIKQDDKIVGELKKLNQSKNMDIIFQDGKISATPTKKRKSPNS